MHDPLRRSKIVAEYIPSKIPLLPKHDAPHCYRFATTSATTTSVRQDVNSGDRRQNDGSWPIAQHEPPRDDEELILYGTITA
ncbi:hypothetical protein [Symmachiella dynata]|uniref:hypothetical protein n=1 Tax=Symmachiella dynata TaxID=2527995 RepID=UPI0011A41068|nr:hypothetical protein [Symmachiella dynata]